MREAVWGWGREGTERGPGGHTALQRESVRGTHKPGYGHEQRGPGGNKALTSAEGPGCEAVETPRMGKARGSLNGPPTQPVSNKPVFLPSYTYARPPKPETCQLPLSPHFFLPHPISIFHGQVLLILPSKYHLCSILVSTHHCLSWAPADRLDPFKSSLHSLPLPASDRSHNQVIFLLSLGPFRSSFSLSKGSTESLEFQQALFHSH